MAAITSSGRCPLINILTILRLRDERRRRTNVSFRGAPFLVIFLLMGTTFKSISHGKNVDPAELDGARSPDEVMMLDLDSDRMAKQPVEWHYHCLYRNAEENAESDTIVRVAPNALIIVVDTQETVKFSYRFVFSFYFNSIEELKAAYA